jgi:hypothetical protein
MTSNTQWLNQLFGIFIRDAKIDLYFEQKEKSVDGVPILNLSIHPIRFADDIFFNFQTNDDELRAKLKKYEVNYNTFYHHADIVKAAYLKSVKKNKIEKNALLLVGQTEKDKVIFDGEKYLSLLDFIPQIREMADAYDSIYFKPHPYAENSRYIYKTLKKEFKNIKTVHENIYHLLSNKNILHVAALNSSVLYEAKYFRKVVTFFYKPTFDFDNEDIGIYGDYWNSSFWSDILDVEDTNILLPFVSSRLRKAINDFWGYNEISDEIILKDIFKSKIKYFLSKYIR